MPSQPSAFVRASTSAGLPCSCSGTRQCSPAIPSPSSTSRRWSYGMSSNGLPSRASTSKNQIHDWHDCWTRCTAAPLRPSRCCSSPKFVRPSESNATISPSRVTGRFANEPRSSPSSGNVGVMSRSVRLRTTSSPSSMAATARTPSHYLPAATSHRATARPGCPAWRASATAERSFTRPCHTVSHSRVAERAYPRGDRFCPTAEQPSVSSSDRYDRGKPTMSCWPCSDQVETRPAALTTEWVRCARSRHGPSRRRRPANAS